MALKKDKQKVLGETFDEARIKTFLNVEAYGRANEDFHILEKAYRGMKADNFTTLVTLFVSDGRDINARNSNGETLLDIVTKHQHGADYATALQQAGAQ